MLHIVQNFTVSEDGKVIIFLTLTEEIIGIPISLLSEFEGVDRIQDYSEWELNGISGLLFFSPNEEDDPLLVYNIIQGLYSSKSWMTLHPEKINTQEEYIYLKQTLPKLPENYIDREWLDNHIHRIEILLASYENSKI